MKRVSRTPFGRNCGGRPARLTAVASAVAAVVVGAASFFQSARAQAPDAPAPCGIDMRILVLSADGQEADLPSITQTLQYLGTPYTTYIALQQPGGLTPEVLGNGCHG